MQREAFFRQRQGVPNVALADVVFIIPAATPIWVYTLAACDDVD